MPEKQELSQNDLTLLNSQDVSKILKINISSVERIPESDLPRVHIGKRSIRYRKQAVLNFILSKEVNNENNYER